jgi:hypothetical protein
MTLTLLYNFWVDIVFSSNVKLYEWTGKRWVKQGCGCLRVTRRVEVSPNLGVIDLSVYCEVGKCIIASHTLEDEMRKVSECAVL